MACESCGGNNPDCAYCHGFGRPVMPKLKICGHEYEIIEERLERAMGVASYTRLEIGIDPRLAPTQREETLLHEVIHVILYHHHAVTEENESLVQAIASGLFQMGIRINAQ